MHACSLNRLSPLPVNPSSHPLQVPADCVLLSSADAQGNAFIQTTNLDGESNLKVRSAIAETKGLTKPAALGGFHGVVECAPPNEHIYKFDSRLRMTADAGAPNLALSASQLLLQATHVRNVDWLYALVVYTGNESKFGRNTRPPPTKYTRTDGFINGVSAGIFCIQLLLVLVFGWVGDVWQTRNAAPGSVWYLDNPANAPWYTPLVIPARFLLLNSTMIPISLKLTLDLCKLFYAKFIDGDLALYDPETDTPARSNSTALSEDLGQVKYILTDKTGTLTENRMVLKAVTVVGGHDYGTVPGVPPPATAAAAAAAAAAGHLPPSLAKLATGGILADVGLYTAAMEEVAAGRAGAARAGDHAELLRCLALNNDVVPGVSPGGERLYKASSPDEEALVKAAAGYGVGLWAREGDVVTILVGGPAAGGKPAGATTEPAQETYTQLGAFEFSSDRKRMSVLLRNESTGGLRLYCKGADDVIMSRLASGQAAAVAAVAAQVDAYAATGLRTLVMSYRDVSAEEYARFKASYAAAASAMTDRDAAKEKVYDGMERGLHLLGASAIEDKLQDGVPETIALLRAAGVNFWMLTGDKFSTALTIARTCNLKTKDSALIEIEGETPEEVRVWGRRLAGGSLAGAGGARNYREHASGRHLTTASLLPPIPIHPPPPHAPQVKAAVTLAHARLVAAGHELVYEEVPTGVVATLQTSLGCCWGSSPAVVGPDGATRSRSDSAARRLSSWTASRNGGLNATSPVSSGSNLEALAGADGGAFKASADGAESPGDFDERHGDLEAAATGEAAARAAAGKPSAALGAAPSGGGREPIGRKQAYTVIIRGSTLEVALKHCLPTFAAVGLGAVSVICCRVTPMQKAQCVRLVKKAGHLTLSIGDGGNDVAMIQEAAVGVGIRGKEGLQAARASDYQVTAFRALQRLLLVHGRYSYYRTALVAQYSFYKSFLFCVIQIGFGFFSGFAGVSLFNSLCVAAYNAVLFVPIVFFLVDRDVLQYTALTQPAAYRMCSEGTLMTARTMVAWLFRGLVRRSRRRCARGVGVVATGAAAWSRPSHRHALTAIFSRPTHPPAFALLRSPLQWQAIALLLVGVYASRFTIMNLGSSPEQSGDYESLGLAVFMAYMFTQDFTMLFSLRRVTWHNVASIFGMHVLAFGIGLIMNAFKGAQSFIDYGSFTSVVRTSFFWLYCLLITVACVVPVQAAVNYAAAFTDSFTNRLYRIDSANEAAGLDGREPPGLSGKGGGAPGAAAGGQYGTLNPVSAGALPASALSPAADVPLLLAAGGGGGGVQLRPAKNATAPAASQATTQHHSAAGTTPPTSQSSTTGPSTSAARDSSAKSRGSRGGRGTKIAVAVANPLSGGGGNGGGGGSR
jgi:magnesium-transporting ATPase (P-type)